MADKPRPYKGQNFKGPSDPYSTWHDLSDPELADKEREAEDALDPDRPSGAHTTPISSRQNCANDGGIRWIRHENIGKQ